MCRVSVLIPVYNVEKYLRQCLDSVICQSLEDIEIICLNDGSKDSSLDILKEYAGRDSRIRIIDKENTGYGHTMNCGIDAAKGEFIGVVESDDFVEPDMFEKLYSEAKKHSAEIVKSNYLEYNDQQGDSFFELLAGYPYYKVIIPSDQELLLCRFVNLWSGIYDRRFLENNNIRFNETPGASYQDIGFSIKSMACAKRVYLIHRAFYHYRIDNPLASVKSKDKPNCVLDEFSCVWDYLDQHKEVFERVKYHIPAIEFLRLRETYDRVDMKYKVKLLYEMKTAFVKLGEKGILNADYWNPEVWTVFLEVGKKDFERMAERQQLYLEVCGFDSAIRYSENIYIYGAGKVGKWTLEYVKKIGRTPNGFLVSGSVEENEKIEGIPVFFVEKIKDELKDSLVLIAVKDDDQIEIFSRLITMGIKNVISVHRDLRRRLNRWEYEKDCSWEDKMSPIPR